MIRHKIEDRSARIAYYELVEIPKSIYERICRLLEIENIEELSEKEKADLDVKEDDEIYAFSVSFEDGASLDWRLFSGTTNYYDDVLFQYPDGKWITLDCSYKLEDIEIDAGKDIYCIHIRKTD